MANRKMNLSGTGKEILDRLCDHLDVDRPYGIHIALAKGIALTNKDMEFEEYKDSKPKWTIPDHIIRDREYLLFKHLIINEVQTSLTEEEINQYMLQYIEFGLRKIQIELEELTSLENYRIKILG